MANIELVKNTGTGNRMRKSPRSRRSIIAVGSAVLIACAAYGLYYTSDTQVALRAMSSAESPIAAWKIARSEIAAQASDGSFSYSNSDLAVAEKKYLGESARKGDSEALRTLYESGSSFLNVQRELAPMLLQKAEGSKDANILVAAASYVGNEELGVPDIDRQIRFLERAWLAGNAQSAATLAWIYQRRKDYETAYLWSLRCASQCVRHGARVGEQVEAISLPTLESQLSRDRITELQSVARDATRL